MNGKYILPALLAGATAFAAHGESTNEIIVTATRIEQPIEQIGSSVEVITSTQIEQSQSSTMLDALELVPGLNIRHSGAPSLRANISLRGAPPETTLIMIDGVPVYDQAHFSGSSAFDFGSMTADSIDRIEVLKGAQSVLYGSSAMSGAINIITKKGAGKATATAFAEYGSYNTVRAGSSVSGGDDKVNFAAGISFMDRQGKSVTNADTSHDKDGRENKNVHAKIGFTPAPGTEINLFTTYLKARGDFDQWPGFPADGSHAYQDQEQLLLGADAKTLLLDGLWEPKLKLSLNQINRADIDPVWGDTWFDSQTLKADFQNSFFLTDQQTLIAGLDVYKDTYAGDSIAKDHLHNEGLYATYQLALMDRWFSTIGLRYDDHSIFGDQTTYQATTAYLIDETGTRLHASFGTGFKAPNSYQLYAPFYGNPSLTDQTSASWDIGADQQITKQIKAGATFFYTTYDNLINYNFSTSAYDNINKMKSQGLETYAEYTPAKNLLIKGSYTYTDNNADGGSYEYYIPNHEIGLIINYAATEKWNINLNAQYVDSTGSSDSYTLVNAANSYQLTDTVQIYGRVTNLLDQKYELSRGYNEDRFGVYAGVKINL